MQRAAIGVSRRARAAFGREEAGSIYARAREGPKKTPDIEWGSPKTCPVPILGPLYKARDDRHDVGDVRAFQLERGDAVKLYAVRPNRAPCRAAEAGFKAAVILPRGSRCSSAGAGRPAHPGRTETGFFSPSISGCRPIPGASRPWQRALSPTSSGKTSVCAIHDERHAAHARRG